MALYRKYRPATFAEVVGQEHVTDPLSIALDTGRISHAYLFSGPRGCGKTSSARILARSLNCVEGPTSTPCGVCHSCVSLGPGGSGNLDVIELDAASHGGVDDTRELRDRAFYAPAESRYRVFIVDEAHMVTTAGFNALLKIVEEPPAHLIFVFATTEPEKVLPTIRSRTHHYPFRLLPPATMRGLLGKICDQENVQVEEAVYPLVIRAGGGSPRDSLSVLDQLLAGAGPDGVTYPRAVSLLGVTDVALIDDAVAALGSGDGATLFGTIDRVVEAGHDPRRFATDLLERLRDLILLRAVPDAIARNLVTGPGDVLERMQAQADAIGPASLARFAELLHEGLGDMRGATAPRLLLEVVAARMLLPAASDAETATLQRLENLERRMAGGALPPAQPAQGSRAPQQPAPHQQPAAQPQPAPQPHAAPPPTGEPRRRGAEALAAIRGNKQPEAPQQHSAPPQQDAAPRQANAPLGAGAQQQAPEPQDVATRQPNAPRDSVATPDSAAAQQASARQQPTSAPQDATDRQSNMPQESATRPDSAAQQGAQSSAPQRDSAPASQGDQPSPARYGEDVAIPAQSRGDVVSADGGSAGGAVQAGAPEGVSPAPVQHGHIASGAAVAAGIAAAQANSEGQGRPIAMRPPEMSAARVTAIAPSPTARRVEELAAEDVSVAASAVPEDVVAQDISSLNTDAGDVDAAPELREPGLDAEPDLDSEPALELDVEPAPAAESALIDELMAASEPSLDGELAPGSGSAIDTGAPSSTDGTPGVDAESGSAAALVAEPSLEYGVDGGAGPDASGAADLTAEPAFDPVREPAPAFGLVPETHGAAVESGTDPAPQPIAESGRAAAPTHAVDASAAVESSVSADASGHDGSAGGGADPDEVLREIEAAWADIRAKVREFGAAVQALLSGASVSRLEGATIVFAHQHAPLAQRLSQPQNLDAVRSAVRAVLGREHDVKWEVGGGGGAAAAAPAKGAGKGPAGAGPAAKKGPAQFSRPSQAKSAPPAASAPAAAPAGWGPAPADEAATAVAPAPERPAEPAPAAPERVFTRGGSAARNTPPEDDIPLPDGPDLPDDPGPSEYSPVGYDGVPPATTEEEEREMLAAAAVPVPAEERRDPDDVALELLRSELGATPLQG